jgi:hypothetical protein
MQAESLEHILVSYHKDDMIAALRVSSHFNDLFELALNTEKLSARSAYMLSHMVHFTKEKVQNNIDKIIEAINGKPDGQQRDLIRTLQQLDLDEDQIGEAYHLCSELWMETLKTPSVRYLAFLFMFNVVKVYPDLKDDFHLMANHLYMESLSPGIKRSLITKINNLK